ncbi:MAG: hypothetical protein NTV74_02910 [Euryarchaeota archaeon]|nr:hypothetical protein [Euryarchaeota archaeon]
MAEKRTSLSMLRTAIAILTLPSSIFTILVVASRYYDISKSIHFAIPLIIICIALIFLGTFLVFRSFKKIKIIDHKIQKITDKDKFIQGILED